MLRYIRQLSDDFPVMMLTARSEDVDEVFGLIWGPTTISGKPFSPIVLSARVRSLIKRRLESAGDRVELFGEVMIDQARREVRVNGKKILLTPKEYVVLFISKTIKTLRCPRKNSERGVGLRLFRRTQNGGQPM